MLFLLSAACVFAAHKVSFNRAIRKQTVLSKISQQCAHLFRSNLTSLVDIHNDHNKLLNRALRTQADIQEYKKEIQTIQKDLTRFYLQMCHKENQLSKIINSLRNNSKEILRKKSLKSKHIYNKSYLQQRIKENLAEKSGAKPFKNSWVQLPSKHDGIAGIDAVFCQFSSAEKPARIILLESKYSKKGRLRLGWTKNGKQMTDSWIEASVKKMQESQDLEVKKTGDMLRSHYSLIERRINVLDGNGKNHWYHLVNNKPVKDPSNWLYVQ